MNIDDAFKKIEDELDKKLESLSIWQLPFQNIMSWLLLAVENIESKGQSDIAMDYTSRLSYIFNIVRKKSKQAPLVTTTEALTSEDFTKYVDDVNFLMAYAHYAMLMPQFHRGTFIVIYNEGKDFKIDFKDQYLQEAETLDRLYSYLSLQMVVGYPKEAAFKKHLLEKASRRDGVLNGSDFSYIQDIYKFSNQVSLTIQVLPNAILAAELGFDYSDYNSFCAAVRAYHDFFSGLGRAYKSLITDQNDPTANDLATEHLEWAVCCINTNTLGWYQYMSGLSADKFKKVFEFYVTIISDTTKEGFKEKAFCGDGYFPPFIWIEDAVLFSSVGSKYMFPLNNLLYSLNKKSEKQFSEKISPFLEPSLIKQLEYLFSFIPDIKIGKNVNYATGEIDFIVLSEKEKIAVCFQVKATIAPDSARTVKRVEDRASEGMDQIRRFDGLKIEDKERIINNEFGTRLTAIEFIHILLVRSCAGSASVWQLNHQYPIVNYAMLSLIIANKIEKKDWIVKNLKQEVWDAQQELLKKSQSKITFDTLKIGNYSIAFPNVESDTDFIMSAHVRILKQLPDFELIPE